jgi:DNA-binding NarL/FixJ family response regulator
MEKKLILKQYFQNYTLLYVEPDKKIRNINLNAFKKIFKQIFTASTSKDTITTLQKYHIDFLIIDLYIYNSFSTIIHILEEFKDVNVIILSYKNQDFRLLQSIDLDIKLFLEKPMVPTKILLNLATLIPQNSQELQIFDELAQLQKNTNKIYLFNNYKGLVIQNEAIILKVSSTYCQLQLSKIQFYVALYEKHTIIKLTSKKFIYAQVLSSNKQKLTIIFVHPKYIEYKTRDINNKRIDVTEDFQATLYIHNTPIETKVANISYKYIVLYITKIDNILYRGIKVDLSLKFDINAPSSMLNHKQTVIAHSSGVVEKIQQTSNNIKLVIKINIKKSSQSIFEKYIKEKEIEAIQELKYNITNL